MYNPYQRESSPPRASPISPRRRTLGFEHDHDLTLSLAPGMYGQPDYAAYGAPPGMGMFGTDASTPSDANHD